MTTEKLYRQIGDEVLEYTAEDYAQAAIDQAQKTESQKVKAKAEADKAALLAKLGISADEAKLLLS
jgi:hypothetical protein